MNLSVLVPSLQRAVAPPGEFDTYFPDADDADLTARLADAVAEAMLDGFLLDNDLDIDEFVISPDLKSSEQALVVLYAMARVLTTQIANLKTRTRYKAGPVESETETAASVLVELLKETNARKQQLLAQAQSRGLATTGFLMADLYVTKQAGWY